MCGVEAMAQADLAVVDRGQVAVLVVEDTSLSNPSFPGDLLPWPQLAAKMVALFQHMQRSQFSRTKTLLLEKIIPGIIFKGTMPYFFTMKVTNDLSENFVNGIRYSPTMIAPSADPSGQPLPPPPLGLLKQCVLNLHYGMGMTLMDQRKVIFGALECFKKFVFPE